MHRAIQIYRRDGWLPVLDALQERLRSLAVRRMHGYPEGFLIGAGTVWLTGSHAQVGRHVRIGKRCRIETIDEHNGLTYMPRLEIGNNVSMNDDVHIGCVSRVRIGNNVLMASKIFISDHNHGTYSGSEQDSPLLSPGLRRLGYAPVDIGDDVWLGEMVTVLPGVTIGNGSIVGSNSVVSKSLPEYSICFGLPAKPVKTYNFRTHRWEKV